MLFYFSDAGTQTPTSLSSDSPRKRALRLEIKKLKRKLEFESPVSSKKKKITEKDVIQFCEDHISDGMTNFIKTHLDMSKRSRKGARYSSEYKQFALTVYFLGPKVYKYLATWLCLPSKSTLYRITKNWEIQPGLNDFMFSVIGSKVSSLPENDRDCILCIDEMSLKRFLFYNRRRDEVVGFHETLSGKTYQPAKNILVLMARGLRSNWKQPVAYFFVNTISSKELKDIIFGTIISLKNLALNVLCLISDQGAIFVKFVKENNITPENPFFMVENQKVFFMFDVPHLLKSTRNNLFKYKLQSPEGVTDKKYLELFYEKDKQQHLRLAPKLTDNHLNPNNFKKMKVNLAAQILSATVAAALNTYIALGALPLSAVFTATFIEKLDKLFDMLNSYKMTDTKQFNKPFVGSELQISFLNEMYCFFDNTKVLQDNGKDITNTMKFINGWKLSIKAFLNLWELLKSKYKFIYTRRLNQDCLENFFGSLRQQAGNARNPTPIQCIQGFKKLFCLNYFQHSEGANCIEDFDKILISANPENIKVFQNVLPEKSIFSNLEIGVADYIELDLPEQNALNYVGGYLVRKCLERHDCELCQVYAKEHQDLSDEVFFSHFKAYENKNKDTFGNLMMPPKNFVEYIYTLETKFCELFPVLSIHPNAGVRIKEEFKSYVMPHPCEYFPKDFLLSLYTRLRMYYTLKYLNRELANIRGFEKNYKLNILRHL